MEPSIFTKIINKEIPATIVYEDDIVVAFLDNNPIHKGHTLVIPRQHVVNIFDADSETIAHMAVIAQKLAKAIKSTLNANGINIHMNNGEAAGQEVFHAHMHVVPRYINDQSYQKPKRCSYNDTGEEATKLGMMISEAIEIRH